MFVLKIKDSQIKSKYKNKAEDVICTIYNTFAGSGLRYQVCSKPFDSYDGMELITSKRNCIKYKNELVEKFPELENSFIIS